MGWRIEVRLEIKIHFVIGKKGKMNIIIHKELINLYLFCFRILKINSENLDKKDKLLNSHLSSVKETKKKDKARQSSSGGSAPGTPVPGERGNLSGGSALTPGELKVKLILKEIYWYLGCKIYRKIALVFTRILLQSHFSP